MHKHGSELADLADSVVELCLEVLNHLVVVLTCRLGGRLERFALVLELGKNLARRVDVIDRGNYLAHLLVVRILALDFILEVLLESLVLDLNSLNISLKNGHRPLLLVQFSRHLS